MNVVKNLNQETSPTDLEKKKEKARKNYENFVKETANAMANHEQRKD
jgi:hypothetical protein